MKKTLTLVALLSSLALSSYAAEAPSVTLEKQQAVAAYAKAQGLDKQAAWQALTPEQKQSKMDNAKEISGGQGAGQGDGGVGAGGASQGAGDGAGAGKRGAGAGTGDHAGANHSAGAGAGAGASRSGGAGAGAGRSR